MVVEETWRTAEKGSVQALARIFSEDATAVVELIVVSDSPDGVQLRISQWTPQMAVLMPTQTMRLASRGENEVKFEATDETGNFLSLTYKRPTENTFSITVAQRSGQVFEVALDRVDPTQQSS